MLRNVSISRCVVVAVGIAFIVGEPGAIPEVLSMFNLMSTFFFFFFLPLLVAVALVDLLTMSPERRARLWRRSGLSQRAIADRMGISRYRVRKYLTV